jgi:hypothetical protein
MEYPDCFAVVEEKVKPERDRLGSKDDPSARGYARLWWQFGRKALDLYAAIAGMERCLVGCQTAKYVSLGFQPVNLVYSHATNVFAFENCSAFALLACSIHDSWARQHSGSLETRLRYSPTDSFETFPFPESLAGLDAIGERYYTHRRQIMLARQQGLTATYNRFHNRDDRADDIETLRKLRVEMDHAVAAAYGWTDLALGHGFHQTKQGIRYTIAEPARRTILDRLLKLNHDRYAAELASGLHEKGMKHKGAEGARGGRRRAAAGNMETLF